MAAKNLPAEKKPTLFTVDVAELAKLVRGTWIAMFRGLEEEALVETPLPFYPEGQLPVVDACSCEFAASIYKLIVAKLSWQARHFPMVSLRWSITKQGHTVRTNVRENTNATDYSIRERVEEAASANWIGNLWMSSNRLDIESASYTNHIPFVMTWGTNPYTGTLVILSNATTVDQKAVMLAIKAVNWPVVALDVQRSNATLRGHMARQVSAQEVAATGKLTNDIIKQQTPKVPKEPKEPNPDLPVLTAKQYKARVAEIEAMTDLTNGQRGGLKAHAKRAYDRFVVQSGK